MLIYVNIVFIVLWFFLLSRALILTPVDEDMEAAPCCYCVILVVTAAQEVLFAPLAPAPCPAPWLDRWLNFILVFVRWERWLLLATALLGGKPAILLLLLFLEVSIEPPVHELFVLMVVWSIIPPPAAAAAAAVADVDEGMISLMRLAEEETEEVDGGGCC